MKKYGEKDTIVVGCPEIRLMLHSQKTIKMEEYPDIGDDPKVEKLLMPREEKKEFFYSYQWRNRQRARFAFTTFSRFQVDTKESLSKDLMLKFLKESSEISQIKDCGEKYWKIIIRVQSWFTSNGKINLARYSALDKGWKEQLGKIRSWCVANKNKNKKAAKYFELVNGMDSEISQLIIKAYLKGCIHYHAYLYFKWRESIRYESEIKEVQEWEKGIDLSGTMKSHEQIAKGIFKFLNRDRDVMIMDTKVKKQKLDQNFRVRPPYINSEDYLVECLPHFRFYPNQLTTQILVRRSAAMKENEIEDLKAL